MGSHASAGSRGESGKRKDKASGSGGSTPAAQQDLGSLIASRLRELNPDAKDHRRRLTRVVVEASLLHEFGSSLITAPKFQAMVDQVLHEVENSPLLQSDMRAVLDDLTSPR